MPSCLIVDDSKVIRRLARSLCEAEGFECVEAENGRLALEACSKGLPDFMLVDWNMPEMDGITFVTALRKLPGGDKPVIVLCTTENDMTHIATAMKAGVNEYIMKPFDRPILRSKLEILGFALQDAC
ncbi:MAG TPA: response regulator [Alphaproteobacteria bacterium]|nr:response regulator [Alphaproteobacteria bacterium]